jgi:hypothetical protein
MFLHAELDISNLKLDMNILLALCSDAHCAWRVGFMCPASVGGILRETP